MKIKSCVVGALVAGLLAFNANANSVIYEVSGDLFGQFLPIGADPIADLLGVPRAQNNTVSSVFQFTVDLDAAPVIIQDNSVAQEYIYPNAVTDVKLSYNGQEFQSIRPLIDQEISIEVFNSVAPSGPDTLSLTLSATFTLLAGSPLFDGEVVPFNQTVNSTFIENAVVTPSTAQFSLLKNDALSSAALPTDASVFDSPTLFPVSSNIFADLGPTFSGGVTLSGGIPLNDLEFSITPVPVPGAVLLLASGLVGLSRFRRNR